MSSVYDVPKVYPSPSLPGGKLVWKKPVIVEFDMTASPYGFPFQLEVVLINQNDIGPMSQKVPFYPGRPIEFELAPFRHFNVGDTVKVYARLYYIVLDPDGPYLAVAETPRSKPYDVVAA